MEQDQVTRECNLKCWPMAGFIDDSKVEFKEREKNYHFQLLLKNQTNPYAGVWLEYLLSCTV